MVHPLNFPDDRKSLLAQGKSKEEVARTVYQMRRDLGVKYKDSTPQPLRDFIYERNLKDYGDPLGPTFKFLLDKDKTWDEIIESACSPNPDIDQLLPDFSEWLRRK